MTNGELLDELASNILRDRSALISGPDDSLWSDETLLRYINEAQYRFARMSLVLRVDADDEPDVCKLRLQTGKKTYILHEKVIAVLSARFHTDEKDLVCINHQTLAGNWSADPTNRWLDTGYSSSTTAATGRPRAYWVDESVQVADRQAKVKMKLDSTPSAEEDGRYIFMRACRMPLVDISDDTIDAACEIPEQYHVDMLEWAAYLALRGHDVDTEMRSKGDVHKKRFEEVVQEVRNDNLRRMHAPVGWAFGRNGFAWTR
jgi:hypothetical protein